MLSVFEKIFKRPDKQFAINPPLETSQKSPLPASQDDSIPNAEITATELISPQSIDLSRDIVFIDGSVENISHLLRELDPAADLYILHLQSDGLEQIADYVSERENLLAIHLFCNGGRDHLNLGSATLTKDRVSKIQLASLERIGAALTEQSDVLIYGCEFGSNDAGAQMISYLSEIIGADIAVSPQIAAHEETAAETQIEASEIDAAEIVAAHEEIPPAKNPSVTKTVDPAIVGKTNGTNGTVVFDITGNITYVADPGFYGEDVFEFSVDTGDTIEQTKVHVNIMPEDEAADVVSVSQFSIILENQITLVTSHHGMSLPERELSLNENGNVELVQLASDAKPSDLSIKLHKTGGAGSPSFKIAVASSNMLPSIRVAEQNEMQTQSIPPTIEVDDIFVEDTTIMAEQLPDSEVNGLIAQPEVIEEVAAQETTETQHPFEDFLGGTLSFPIDPQLQEPELTGNSIVGHLIVDCYVRPGTLFLNVNNSFDPREQGVVSRYQVNLADGSPLPEYVQTIRDGFIAVDQEAADGELNILIAVEMVDGHTLSRTLRVNIETGALLAMQIDSPDEVSHEQTASSILVADGSEVKSNVPLGH